MGRQWLGRSLPRDLLRSNCHWNVGGKVKLGDVVCCWCSKEIEVQKCLSMVRSMLRESVK